MRQRLLSVTKFPGLLSKLPNPFKLDLAMCLISSQWNVIGNAVGPSKPGPEKSSMCNKILWSFPVWLNLSDYGSHIEDGKMTKCNKPRSWIATWRRVAYHQQTVPILDAEWARNKILH